MNKKTIGVAIIAKNESAMISRCLESVKGADQIVVVDTGSSDNTMEIARRYTSEVYDDFKWCDDFAQARNHVRSKMKTDFILSIDCDEFCHDFSKVREAIEWGYDVLNVRMIMGHTDPEQHFYFPRLFKNTPNIFWVGAIHNVLNVAATKDSEVKITYEFSPAHLLDPDRALRILESEVKKNPNNPRELYYLGREYWYKQRYQECTATLGRYVQVAHWNPEKADAFLIMARAYSTQGLDEDARDACLQAIKINPNFKEAILFMAAIVPDNHAVQWKRMAETADNTDILFKRV
jgi:glycosyltransferase involved in cell wall biosynthesis